MTTLAEGGDKEAQYFLGMSYKSTFHRAGVPHNYELAAYWLLKSAKQGDEAAQHNLAMLYENGYGVAQDYRKAVWWHKKAAAQGCDGSKTCLLRILSGDDVPSNKKEAKRYRWRGKIPEIEDFGTEIKSILKTWQLLKKAPGNCKKGINALKKSDYETAHAEFQMLAKKNIKEAQFFLGWMYALGIGVDKKVEELNDWYKKEAVTLYTKSAEQGFDAAQYYLGKTIYYEGGVDDYILAYAWLELATSQGNKKSSDLRNHLFALMTPYEISKAIELSEEFQNKINAKLENKHDALSK
jgi:hypothetical protein